MAQVGKHDAIMNTRIRFIFRDKMESVRKSIQKCFRLYYPTIKTTVEVTDDYQHDPVIPITFNLGQEIPQGRVEQLYLQQDINTVNQRKPKCLEELLDEELSFLSSKERYMLTKTVSATLTSINLSVHFQYVGDRNDKPF